MEIKGIINFRKSERSIDMFSFRHFSPFYDDIPYNNVTTQFAERFYLFLIHFIIKMCI